MNATRSKPRASTGASTHSSVTVHITGFFLRAQHGSFSHATTKDCAMHNGRKTNVNTRHPRPAAPFAGRSKRWSSNAARPEQNGSHNARRNYERYLALAQAEAQSGNTVAAENYYQHAEHYFRSMSSDRGTT
jgi:hypothetical protein